MISLLLAILLVFGISSLSANTKIEKDYTKINFSQDELQGKWIKVDCPYFHVVVNKIDISEKKYQMLTFISDNYLFESTDDKEQFLKDRKIFNFNDFILKDSNTPNQWLGLYSYPKFIYFGITKINEKTKIKKIIEGYLIADLQVGDMVLTLYNSKTNQIVYRLQYRKIKEKQKEWFLNHSFFLFKIIFDYCKLVMYFS